MKAKVKLGFTDFYFVDQLNLSDFDSNAEET